MAYVLNEEEDDQKQQAANPYAALSQPLAEEAAGGGVAAIPATQAAKATSTKPQSRFVSMDRYFDANKDAITRTADQTLGTLQLNAEKAQKSVADTQKDVLARANSGVVQGPNAGTVATSGGILDMNASPLLPNGTHAQGANYAGAEAEALKNQAYSGPTQDDVRAKYDEIFKNVYSAQKDLANAANGDYSGLTGAPQLNPFDSLLMGGAVGDRARNLNAQYSGLGQSLDSARDASKGAIDAAQTKSEASDKAYEDLYKQYMDLRDAENARQSDFKKTNDQAKWGGLMTAYLGSNGKDPLAAQTGKRPTGEDIVNGQARDTGFGTLNMFDKIGPGKAADVAKTFDKMNDADLQRALELMSRGGELFSPLNPNTGELISLLGKNGLRL